MGLINTAVDMVCLSSVGYTPYPTGEKHTISTCNDINSLQAACFCIPSSQVLRLQKKCRIS